MLATALNATLRHLSEPVCSALESLGLSERPWLIHWLVGDGVGTNEAAAKILIAWLGAQPLAARVRYFLLVVKCANHQANLAIGSAVSGKTALAGSRYAGSLEAPLVARALAHAKKSVATEVCGAVVRLFKYLVSDYYADFLSNLHDIVGRIAPAAASAFRQQQFQTWRGMQRVYGTSVLPIESWYASMATSVIGPTARRRLLERLPRQPERLNQIRQLCRQRLGWVQFATLFSRCCDGASLSWMSSRR